MIVTRIDSLPAGIESLERAATSEGLRMVQRLVEDFCSGVNRFDRPGEGLWAATDDTELLGVCGLNIDPYAAPEERAGRVRRLYVSPTRRRNGVASALLDAVIDEARHRFAALTAFTQSPEAIAFYRAHGFTEVHRLDKRTVLLPLVSATR